MSNFPGDYDNDVTLPFVNDNITEIGGEATNALRDAVLALEQNIGLGAAGTTGSIANRLSVSFFPDGYLKPSVIASLGLVTLPITGNQIAAWAEIPESKLKLDHRTQDLFNYIRDLSGDINLAIGWISTEGIKINPHVLGALYQHSLEHILVTSGSAFLSNKFRNFRNNSNASTAINDLNDELLAHQWADGSPFGDIKNVTTNNGSVYPSNYAHFAGGIYLNTSRFTLIPQTAYDVQLFAEFIDSSSVFLLGTRIQNLYTNGISRISRAQTLDLDTYGQHLVPSTPVIAYLKNIGNNSTPFDDIDTGDDIVEFKPSTENMDSNLFDSQFALVKVGDIIRVNYGSVEIPFLIKEKKYIQNGGNKKYVVRIAGKNIAYVDDSVASARIDKPLANNNKYGILSLSAVNNSFNEMPSLIINSPKGGEAFGVGFNPHQLDEEHYLLYLALYPTGNPDDGYTLLKGIDVTGNLGKTPGQYTLESVVEATNNAFRASGYNYRFAAFSYQGEFGIMLADSYNNAAFSILSGLVDENGFYDEVASNLEFAKNVVDVFSTYTGGGTDPFSYGDLSGVVGIDPLGFGPTKGNVASPPYMNSYGSAEAAQNPTKLFIPLNKKNYYVNGAERDRFNLEVGQALDPLGDGYWVGTIVAKSIFPSPGGRVQLTYRIPLDLSTSNLKAGKTVVIQSLGPGTTVDFGRFIIQDVSFGCDPVNYTDITIYDAAHGSGVSPPLGNTLGIDGYAAIYFNSNSVSFNAETSTDFSEASPFKRHFEVYTNSDGQTFTHERGRIYIGGASILINSTTNLYSSTELAKLDIVKISPKLRGYQFGSVNKITLQIDNYNSVSGILSGYLASYDGAVLKKQGPTVSGKKGQIIRFYDETHVDYIDIIFDIKNDVATISNQKIDFQLFPTLSLDDEIMLIGTCQLNDTSLKVTQVRDERQFGNISEKEISTSLLNFMAAPERLLHFNGVVRGFDIVYVEDEKVVLRGGIALVNGKFQYPNDSTVTFPLVKEFYAFNYYPINWALCINSIGEMTIIPLTDYDSVNNTPNAPSRIIELYNETSANSYDVDSTTFSYLINNRKDLTILYIVSSIVTGTGPTATISLTYKDVRRYINDQDSNIPVVITTDSAQGNFKNINTAINWLRFNSDLQNNLIIKGAATVTSAFNNQDGMSIYPQGSGASLSFSSSVNITDFRFSDLPITIFGTSDISNTSIENCGTSQLVGAATLTTVNISKFINFVFGSSSSLTDCYFVNCSGNVNFNSSGTIDGCTFSNNQNLTISGTATFTNSELNDIDVVSLAAGSSFSSRCTINDIGTLNMAFSGVNSVTFDDTNIDNIGVMTIGGNGVSFSNGIINGIIDGNITGSGTVSFNNNVVSDSTINSPTTWTADGSQFSNYHATIGTTATITDCKFYNSTLDISSTSIVTDCVFDNCIITFSDATVLNGVKFTNCELIFTNGGDFTDVVIDPSTMSIGATITTNGVSITDTAIDVSVVRAFTLADNFNFKRNTVTWSVIPVSGYNPTDIVNSSDGLMYANVGNEVISNITVEDNIFNYSMPDRFPFFSIQLSNLAAVAKNISVSRNKFDSTALSDDLRAVIAIVSTLLTRAALGVFPQFPALINVHIDENVCNYNQLIIITGTKDHSIGAMNGANPAVTNTTISRNICGTIGYFIASAGPYDGNNVVSPNFGIIRDKVNKLIISQNYCRFIANLDGYGDYICFRATNYPDANVAEEVASTVGDCLISSNTCNWIQVGCGGYTVGPSIVEIMDNNLSPFDSTFLSNYNSTTTYQTIVPGNVGILVRRPHNATDTLAGSVISGNTLAQKYTTTASSGVTITAATDAAPIVITTSGAHGFAAGQQVTISGVAGNTAAIGTWIIAESPAPTSNTFALLGSSGNGPYSSGGVAVSTNVYYYDAGIASFNNTRINNNRICGVINSDNSPLIYFWDVFKTAIVSSNVLERRGLNCKAFIWFNRYQPGPSDYVTILVNDNVLDNTTFSSGAIDRSFLSYDRYPTAGDWTNYLPSGLVIRDNVVQTGPTTFDLRYIDGKSTKYSYT